MFSKLSIAGLLLLSSAVHAEVLDSPLQADWSYVTFGTDIAGAGLVQVDFDGDGTPETIISIQTGARWAELDYDQKSEAYSLGWKSPVYSDSKLTSLMAMPDGRTLAAATADGTIELWSGATPSIEVSTNIGEAVEQLLYGDADNDGADDLVVLTSEQTFILDPVTLAQRRVIPYGGISAALAAFEGNGKNQLVTNYGYVIQQTNNKTKLMWDYSANGFGAEVVATDIDGDGKAELIGAASWYSIRAYDIDIKSIKYEINSSQDIAQLSLADVTGDGKPEILFGDGQWGGVHALQASDGSELWEADNPNYGFSRIAVIDSNHDGKLELIWTAGYGSSGADNLYVDDLATLTNEWTSQDIDPPFTSTSIGDVDGDGKLELVASTDSSDSGYSDGLIMVFNAKTGKLKWSTAPDTFSGFAWTGIHAVKAADLDGDGIDEILVGTDRLYDGVIYVIDGRTHEVTQRWDYDDGSPIYSIDVGDADGDGTLDIVAGSGAADTASDGPQVYVIDPETGAVKWKSFSLGTYWGAVNEVRIANVDDDASPEIVAVNGTMYVFDGQTHENWQTTASNYTSFDLLWRKSSNLSLIVAGDTSGQLTLIKSEKQKELPLLSACDGSIQGMSAVNSEKDRFVLVCDKQLSMYDYSDNSIEWSVPDVESPAKPGSNLSVWKSNGSWHAGIGGATTLQVLSEP